MFKSADSLFRPKSVAIIGASDSAPNHYSKVIFDNLRASGADIRIHLVNPRRTALWGEPVYATCRDVPEPVDIVLATVGSDRVIASLQDGVANGARAAIIYANDFGEGGSTTGAQKVEELKALCRDSGIAACGPNCMGVLSLRERMLFYPSPRVRQFPVGPVGVIFQSGGTFQFWLQQGAIRGLGYSYAVSSGNELDLDLADYISFMVDDPHTRVVACLVEGIRRPQAFMAAAAKALAAGKPIVMTKIGSSERGRDATMTHTGSLAGNDDVFNALCRRYGVVRTESLDDLMETTLAFQSGRLPGGGRIAMVCHSGGAKGLFLDSAARENAELATLAPATAKAISAWIDPILPAESPLDIGAATARDRGNYTRVCRTILDDPNVDMLTIQGNLPMAPGERDIDRLDYAELMAGATKPVVMFGRHRQNLTPEATSIQAAAGVPFLQGIPETLRAMCALARFTEARKKPPIPVPPSALPPRAEHGGETSKDALTETLAAQYGVTLPNSAVAASVSEVAVAAAQVGSRVAIKLVSEQALHKTEVGGVALNVEPAAAAGVAEKMVAAFERHCPQGRVDGFLVQEMVDGVEIIVGVRTDPQFGPYLVVGLGGVLVEVMQDVSIRLLPVAAPEVIEMLGELRGARLLEAFRGCPAPDMEALARAISGVADFYLAHSDIVDEMEINPLIALPAGKGVRAVDVRIVTKAERTRDGL